MKGSLATKISSAVTILFSVATIVFAILAIFQILPIDLVMVMLAVTQIASGFNLIFIQNDDKKANPDEVIKRGYPIFNIVFGIVLIIAVILKAIFIN